MSVCTGSCHVHLHSLSPFHYWVPWIIFSTDLDSPTLQLGDQVLQGQALLLLVNTSTDIKGFYSPARRWPSSNGVYSPASFYYSKHFGHHHCEYLRVSPEKKWVIWRPSPTSQCLHYRPLSLSLSNVFSYPVWPAVLYSSRLIFGLALMATKGLVTRWVPQEHLMGLMNHEHCVRNSRNFTEVFLKSKKMKECLLMHYNTCITIIVADGVRAR